MNCIAKTLRTSALFETTATMVEMAVLFDVKSPAFIWIWLLFTAHYYFSFLRNFYRAYHKKFSVKNFVDEESLGAVYFALANLVAFDVLIFFHMELFFLLILVSHFFAMHYMQWQAYKGIKMGSTEENETKEQKTKQEDDAKTIEETNVKKEETKSNICQKGRGRRNRGKKKGEVEKKTKAVKVTQMEEEKLEEDMTN